MTSQENQNPYPETWTNCRLGDVLTLINGRAYGKHEMLAEGTPILRIQNLNGGKNWFYSNLDLPSDKYCHHGDLLYAWSATFGPYWSRWKEKLIYHYHIWKIEPSEAATKEFSFYELWRITEDIKAAAHGVAMPHITKAGMEDWRIVLPPLAEQKQIAAKLDELLAQVDTLKARLDAIPAVLKRFRQSVLAAAVSGRLTEGWREERSLSEWEEISLNDASAHIVDCPHSTPIWSDTGKYCVRTTGFNPFFLDLTDQGFVSEEIYAERTKRLKPLPGDILYSREGTVGVACQIPNGVDLCLGQRMVLIRAAKRALPKYLTIVLNSEQILTIVRSLTIGSTAPRINMKEIKMYPIPLPRLEEQTEIVRRVEQLFAFADQIEQRVRDAQARVNHLTQSILAKAFRGELTADWRAQNPALISGDNSAEALLARIRAARVEQPKAKRGRKLAKL